MKWVLSALALCLSLTGCAALPSAHQIEDTVLMQALGVDVGRSLDGVAVTAASAARPTAGNAPGQEPVVLTAQAGTVTAACVDIQTQGGNFVFFGDVEQFLIGEEQAVRGLTPVLEHMAKDPELRLEAGIWVIKGAEAAQAFEATVDAADRLATLAADGRLFATTLPRTAREALVDLARNGCTFLPALGLEPAEGEEQILVAAGCGIFKDGVLAGWAEEMAAKGIGLLLGRGEGEILEVTTPECARAALKLTSVRTQVEPVFEGEILTGLDVRCRVRGTVPEYRGTGSLTEEELGWLSEELGRIAEARIRAALDLAQGLDADYLNLEGKAALAAPWDKERIEAQWAKAFPALKLELHAEGTVER